MPTIRRVNGECHGAVVMKLTLCVIYSFIYLIDVLGCTQTLDYIHVFHLYNLGRYHGGMKPGRVQGKPTTIYRFPTDLRVYCWRGHQNEQDLSSCSNYIDENC